MDVGCATGTLLVRFLEAGYSVLGLDCSEGMLSEAERRAFEWEMQQMSDRYFAPAEDGVSGTETPKDVSHESTHPDVLPYPHHYVLYALDALRDPWPTSEPVQAVVSWLNTVNHFAPVEIPAFLREAWRVTASGGLLLFDAMDGVCMERDYGEQVFRYLRGLQQLTWENHYDATHRCNPAQVRLEERSLRKGRRILGETQVLAYPHERETILEQASVCGWRLFEAKDGLGAGRWQYLFQKPFTL